jgi:hypothetical protein
VPQLVPTHDLEAGAELNVEVGVWNKLEVGADERGGSDDEDGGR